jgi:hypothetical protein
MTDPQTVTVYSYRILDHGVERARLARFKTTRERIAASFEAQILEGTAEEVLESALDAQGRYCRVATGWGEH